MRRGLLAALGALMPLLCGGTCLGEVKPEPSNWERPGGVKTDPPTSPRAAVVVADGGSSDGGLDELEATSAQPLAEETALRTLVKPPSLCFADPANCGLAVAAMSLSALRPTEETLDRVEAALAANLDWPLPSRMVHCETLAAFRPLSGAACVRKLGDDGGISEVARRVQLLTLLEITGRHGNSVALQWLKHPDLAVRRDVAAWFAPRAVDDALAQPLIEALNLEPDATAAVSLTRALGTLLSPKALPLLSTLARGSPQADVRAAAILALGELMGPRGRPFITETPRNDDVVAAAIREALGKMDALEEGRDPYTFEVPLHVLLQRPDTKVGAWAFLEDFKSRRGGPLPTASGTRLNRAELKLLLQRLADAGGFGLTLALPTLAISATLDDVPALLDLRRAIVAARLPDHAAMSADVTKVIRVVRTHHVLGRATRWWYTNQLGEGDQLRLYP